MSYLTPYLPLIRAYVNVTGYVGFIYGFAPPLFRSLMSTAEGTPAIPLTQILPLAIGYMIGGIWYGVLFPISIPYSIYYVLRYELIDKTLIQHDE